MDRLARDKKFKSGKIRFVTLSEIGKAQVIETVTPADLEEAIEILRTERCLRRRVPRNAEL